jgi:hypothetical protein
MDEEELINQYYILPIAQLNLLDNSEVVETPATARLSNNKQQVVCKTKVGVVNPPFMNPNTAYTHAEILAEMAKTAWAAPDIIT